MKIEVKIIKTLVKRFPAVIPHLKGRARWVAQTSLQLKYFWYEQGYTKTYDYFLQQLEGLIKGVYAGNVGGDFIDIMANLISGQLTQAFEQAWSDEEGEGDLPDYLSSALEDMILGQYDFVDQLYKDIVDARVDQTPVESLLARAPLWANRWTEAYNQAVHLITMENGGNEEWVLGATETHCVTCAALNGIVARASEWDALGVHPQNAPNDVLECGGWHCDCKRQPTDKRRSPKAYETIQNIVSK